MLYLPFDEFLKSEMGFLIIVINDAQELNEVLENFMNTVDYLHRLMVTYNVK